MIARAILSGFLLLLLSSPEALADKQEEAAAFKTLARAAFGAGEFRKCAEYFSQSHALVPDPKNLFNKGLCYDKAGEVAEAITAFGEYLRASPKGDKAAEAATRKELLELKLSKLESVQPPARTPQRPPAPERSAPPSENEVGSDGAPADGSDELAAARTRKEDSVRSRRKLKKVLAAETASAAERPPTTVSAQQPARRRYKRPFNDKNVHLRLGLGLAQLSDDVDSGLSPELKFIGQIPASFGDPNPNKIGLVMSAFYTPLWGMSIGLGFRYTVSLLVFRPYAEFGLGMQQRFHDGADLGFDLPLRAGLEVPISHFVLGLQYSTRPLDDSTAGFGANLAYMF